jgi:HSF-type DNA-binding
MHTFALLSADFFPLDIMDRDFSEKPSLKDIELTKSNQGNPDNMIHPSSSLIAPQSLRDVSSPKDTSRAASPGNAAKVVDPNHFPTHLYKMLEEIDNRAGVAADLVEGKTFVSIVSWQPHGKCFLIHDEDMFSKYVLPKYFCRLKFTSFQRQLHFHGFKRLCKQGESSHCPCSSVTCSVLSQLSITLPLLLLYDRT